MPNRPFYRSSLNVFVFCTAVFACSSWAGTPVNDMVRHVQTKADGTTAFTFNRVQYSGSDLSDLPIGVFDSGIGGLTVLEALLSSDAFNNQTLQPGADGKPDFANERFIYFGDQANMPYGNYTAAGKTDYLRELILKDAVFLLGNRRHSADGAVHFDKPPVKAIVIACNTATAYGLDDIRACINAWKLPVIVVGVVEAGARGVRGSTSSEAGAIGVLATVGTCASGAYPRLITSTLGLAGMSVPAITQHGSASLAGVIEGDTAFKNSVPQQTLVDVKALVEQHQLSAAAAPLRTIVLGCTHFPLVRQEIDQSFAKLRENAKYQGFISPSLIYIDPAEWTARELFRELASSKLRCTSSEAARSPRHLFYLSIANVQCKDAQLSPEGGLTPAYKYGRETGRWDIEDVLNVPLTADGLPASSRGLVKGKLPSVWRALTEP